MRSFLLSCFTNHIHNVYRVKTAQKRGGNAQTVPMTGIEEVEREIKEVAALSLTPDQVYDRQCALSLVADVLTIIEDEQVKAGRGHVYAALRPLLDPNARQTTASQEEIAMELGISHGAFRGALMRLRQRFREVTRLLISQTLRSPSEQEIDEELTLLRQSLRHLERVGQQGTIGLGSAEFARRRFSDRMRGRSRTGCRCERR